MQTEKDLFDLIREAYPLNPREEFVSSTSNKLKQTARKLTIKRRIKKFSVATTIFAISAITLSWFTFYGGKEVIFNNLNTYQEKNSASSPTVSSQVPLVYLYQTHNLESFFTETKTNDSNEAFHETKNITLVGERLSQSLKKSGIKSIHDETNIMQILKQKKLPLRESYKVSREPLKDAVKKNKSIKMVFDLHRDTLKRSETTINLDGKDYPRIAFIVSKASFNYGVNLKFAELLHKYIEEKYPHLSRGVIVKDNPPNQNTYNQDLFGNSVLLEIGGTENTLDEEYRTVDVLSEIIKEILSDWTEQKKQ
ncbi:stage II sporulation protein P [Neobacillus sp. PS3-40]|uniref:stage II sporulation protein P n=1 Tax=Neobacillus sp. PS3-40 TaxID=3070679 RepID=UPI0027E1C3CD|nr:stage II sporulation protein P [Neobacillus sp. PS3-40]WML45431.1 stage II sporulation protein P [Neobacillus sp. PS3-40]